MWNGVLFSSERICSDSNFVFPSSPMETCCLGEELGVKVRKPYTITKQRERWTDEEHNRFLEALKLYGRAWQSIEDHIGTKTAVQIRSHAQKFFSKLEKEALSKGVPLEQALDIDIPPPRPKRKPSNPYPRKACVGAILSSKEVNDKSELPPITTTCQNKTLHLKDSAQLEKVVGVESSERAEDNSENGDCSVVLTLFRDVPCVSVSSEKESFATPQYFKKSVPFLKDRNHKPEKEKSSLTAKENNESTQRTADSSDMDVSRIEGLHINPQKEVPKNSIAHKQPQEVAITSNCELQGTRSTTKHAGFFPTEVNNVNSGQCANPNPSNVTTMPNPEEAPIHPIPPFSNPSFTARPEQSTHPGLSFFHPPTGQVNASPSMAAIAAATVAAATAWWATHGPFPFCHPLISTGCFFASTPQATGPTTLNNHSPESGAARQADPAQLHKLQDEHVLDAESPDDLVMQCSCSKSSTLASSDSDGSGGERPGGVDLNDSDVKDLDLSHNGGFRNYRNKTENSENIDSCLCGPNKSSSNKKETKVVLEKDGKQEDKLASFNNTNKDPEEKASFSETKYCRFRSSGSVRESGKEVSEEGRLAFQALFSRKVLPQSFSFAEGEDGTTNLDERIATCSPVNLNGNVCVDHIVFDPFPSLESSSRSNNQSDKSILTHEYGYGKLKFKQTGFKPYKRCSMEVKEGRASAADDKRSKRSRLAGEASTS